MFEINNFDKKEVEFMVLAFIQAIENEDDRALATKIFNDQFPRMKAISYKILNNKEDAEDAAMEAMRAICQNIHLFRSYASGECLCLISLCTKNAAIDIYRKNKRNSENLETIFDDTDSTDDVNAIEKIIVSYENTEILTNAIEALDEMYRAPILLKYTYNLKHEEIAKILNIDAVTVTGRLFRARKKLAEALIKAGVQAHDFE